MRIRIGQLELPFFLVFCFVIQKFHLILRKNCFEMTAEEKINYWIELSDYDLETASAMLQTKRYLYVGGYPDDKKELAKKLNHAKCVEILDKTKNLQQWTKEKLLLIK